MTRILVVTLLAMLAVSSAMAADSGKAHGTAPNAAVLEPSKPYSTDFEDSPTDDWTDTYWTGGNGAGGDSDSESNDPHGATHFFIDAGGARCWPGGCPRAYEGDAISHSSVNGGEGQWCWAWRRITVPAGTGVLISFEGSGLALPAPGSQYYAYFGYILGGSQPVNPGGNTLPAGFSYPEDGTWDNGVLAKALQQLDSVNDEYDTFTKTISTGANTVLWLYGQCYNDWDVSGQIASTVLVDNIEVTEVSPVMDWALFY